MKKIISAILIFLACFGLAMVVNAADAEDIVYTQYNNEYGWYYTVNGKVQPNYSGIKHNSNGWWRVVNGKVDFNANGIYMNEYGWWKTTDGKVTFNENGVFHNENGWWCVQNSKVNFNANGIYQNSAGWWKTTNGRVTFNETGIFHNENGWWRVVNSQVDFSANGIYHNSAGWWKTTNGRVTFNENGVFHNEYGWWCVENSKVNFNANGIYKNEYGWWKTTNGRVTFNETGIFPNANGWWRVVNSKVDMDANGIYENSNGRWKVKGGKVDFDFNGEYISGNLVYNINNGKVISTENISGSHDWDSTDAVNIAFLGIDWQENRSDVMMILSVDPVKNRISVISLLRDSKVNIDGCSVGTKIGYAYKWGGPELALKTINQNFGTDIDKYFCLWFDGMADIINYLGGVNINLTAEEAENVNSLAHQLGYYEDDAHEGWNLLNGEQAVSFARVRKVDNEYWRSKRQQKVLAEMFRILTQKDKSYYPAFIAMAVSHMKETNLDMDLLKSFTELNMSTLELYQTTIPDPDYEDDVWGGWDETPETLPSDPLLDNPQWLWIYDLRKASERIWRTIK